MNLPMRCDLSARCETETETKVGHHHKRGGAAFGRATCFVVSFVLALNRVNIVAVTTILVLYVGVILHHVRRHWGFIILGINGKP